MSWFVYALLATTLLLGLLRETRVWWLAGLTSAVTGFVLMAVGGKATGILAGVLLLAYAFVLLLAGAWLFGRYQDAQQIPKATVRS
jgi:hypothetical protein